MSTDCWWKRAVVYQIYPMSFQDSNGDGVGDIKGIISRLDYLNDGTPNSLGVDAIWLSPVNRSPMRDGGYDISDYREVDPLFGNLDDFKLLLREAHARNIKVLMDLVINHTSDQHPWFKESRSSKYSPKRDWYIWQPYNGGRKPNNWVSLFEMRSAWWWDRETNEYYLGSFTRHQPEVNWRHPKLKQEMYDIIRFWLDLGVDGFRMDVVNWYIKDDLYRSNHWMISWNPPDVQKHVYDRNRPETHAICREIRAIVDAYGDRVLIGEIYTADTGEAVSYHGSGDDELHLTFNFNFLFQRWSARDFIRAVRDYYRLLPPFAWPNFTLSNHDQRRHYHRYKAGRDTDARAQVAAAMLLTLRGTPFLYYGEEIGMTCECIPHREIRDPLGQKGWPFVRGRDPERTPMQWNGSFNAGFSAGRPWLRLNSDYLDKNVDAQNKDRRSLLSFYRLLVWLRKKTKALTVGDIEFLESPNSIMAYRRSCGTQEVIVILNFSPKRQALQLSLVQEHNVLLGTERDTGVKVLPGSLDIHPYEVLISANEG